MLELVGQMIEPCYLSWEHFVPFPRGYIFWTPKNDTKRSVFLKFKKIETDIIENSGHVICDRGNYFSESEYSKNVLQSFTEQSKNTHAIELRMREACILDEDSLTFIFQRHNAFLHEIGEEAIIEAIIYLSCCYGWDQSQELPEQLANFRNKCYLSCEDIILYVKDQPFINNLSYNLDFGICWKGDELGPFTIFEENDYWFVAQKKDGAVIMKHFLHKLDAQIHTEALYSYYCGSTCDDFLTENISVLDYILLDNFPLKKGIVRDVSTTKKKRQEDDDADFDGWQEYE